MDDDNARITDDESKNKIQVDSVEEENVSPLYFFGPSMYLLVRNFFHFSL